MKDPLGYMSPHHEDLEKSFSDEQKEIFEKFHDCWSEYMSLGEAAIFEYASKLSARIALAVMYEQSQDKGIAVKNDRDESYPIHSLMRSLSKHYSDMLTITR